MNSTPLVIAHRGASGYRPEHTRAAYLLAIEQGADAIEPDIVATRDGVLVLRHENEISGTTDVVGRPEFANRRTTKQIDGASLTGWFTEDFTWAELSTLRAIERLPKLRGREHDGQEPILRLVDLLQILDATPRPVALVAEIKHPSYFQSIGLPLDELFAAELVASGWDGDARLTVECFELGVLHRIRDRGIRGRYVFLLEASGSPADDPATTFAEFLTPTGLARLAGVVDGISVDKHILLQTDDAGDVSGVTDLVDRAHAAGLTVFCWTLRAENKFLARNLRHGASKSAFGDWRREYRLIMGSGVDGVFADQPDLALEVRAEL